MNHPEPARLDRTPSIEPDQGGHPLFPRPETETGPDPRKFDIIVIQRWLPDGTREVCPKPWKGSELRSWQQVIDQYGGECTYQLGAQCGKTHRFQAWSDKMFFAGPTRKPFCEEPRTPAPAQPTPAAHYPYPPMPPQSGRSDDHMVALIRVMMETNATIQTAILKSLLERQPQNDALMVVREIMPLIKGDNPGKVSAGAGYERGMERGIELAKQIGGAGPSGGGSDDLGDLEKVFRLFTLAKSTTTPSTQPSQPPQPQPAPSWPAAPHGYAQPVGSWDGWECFQTPMGWVMRQASPTAASQPPFPWSAPPSPAPPPPPAAPPAPPAPAAPPPMPAAPAAAPAPAAPPAPVAMPPVPAAAHMPEAAPPAPVAPAPAAAAPPLAPAAPPPAPIAPPALTVAPAPAAPPHASPAPEAPVSVPEAVTAAHNLAAKVLNPPPTPMPRPAESDPAKHATPPGFPRSAIGAPFLTAAGLVPAPDDALFEGEPDDNPFRSVMTAGSAPLLENPAFVEKAQAMLLTGDMHALGDLLAMATQKKRGSP